MRKLLAVVGLVPAVMIVTSGIALAQDDVVPTSEAPSAESPTTAPTSTSTLPEVTTTVPTPTPPEEDLAPEGPSTTISAPTTTAAAPVALAQQCEPSYPTICLPPGIDVNCGDIPQWGNFRVLEPDPFELDGNDDDGIGCESNTSGSPTDPNVVSTVPATVPTTLPTTSPPVTVPPTTAPVEVGGVTQTPQSGALPVTGAPSTLLGVLGVVVMALGVVVIATRGRLDNPLTGRLRGGFTFTTTNRRGEQLSYRVTSRR